MLDSSTINTSPVLGYTSGVFDLFHVGHLRILQRASEFVDILIVGVSTDELCEQYKSRRPIIRFEDRIEIISSLSCVHLAEPQTDLLKLDAWERHKFQYLFHGSDWEKSPLYEKIFNELQPRGVKFIFLEPTTGISSSIIKQTILSGHDGTQF